MRQLQARLIKVYEHDSYKLDPEKMVYERDSYEADPEKKKTYERDSATATSHSVSPENDW